MRRIIYIVFLNVITLFALFISFEIASAGLPTVSPARLENRDFSVVDLSASISATENMLSVCSRHAPKCPLDAARWPEGDDGWQFTGKKWSWYANTPIYKNRINVWEWSQPYSGDTNEYIEHREDQYTDFTNTPDDYLITKVGTPPVTYDWERWMEDGGNYRMMQLGNLSESESYLVGETDCESGVFYPVVDHILNYAFTPMASARIGYCSKVGYISSVLIEMYGVPGSKTREEKCNDQTYGVPLLHSPTGNAICNMSPYVGKIYQRYVFGPEFPGALATIGCEAVVYAWGWNPPHEPQSGQDYESWFRNGELRFSRWHGITSLVIPNPDDDEWWNTRCEGAWTQQANWLYTGTFRAGMGIYTDRVVKQEKEQFNLPESGGMVNLSDANVKYTFPDSAFSENVLLTSMNVFPEEIPLSMWNRVLEGPFRIYAERESDSELIQPSSQYIIEATYDGSNQHLAEDNRIGIYSWNGRKWQKALSSFLSVGDNSISAFSDDLQVWAVLAEPYQVFLPRVLLVK